MKFFKKSTCALLFVIGLSSQASATVIELSTSDNRFDANVDNQGWWSSSAANVNDNDNYFTGTSRGDVLRSFFTFDLPSLLIGEVVLEATLRLTPFGVLDNDGVETLEFFDVTTNAATLNNNDGTNAAIFADLGSGISYGTFEFNSRKLRPVFDISLNSDALVDINAGLGGFFSIGGSLISDGGNDFVFGASGQTGIQELKLKTSAPSNDVPEPATLALFAVGLAGLGVVRRRRKSVTSQKAANV